MYDYDMIAKVKELYAMHNCLSKVTSILAMPLSTISYMVKNDYLKAKKKRGRAFKLSQREYLRIKKKVRRLNNQNEKVTAAKLADHLGLGCSTRTVQRQLTRLGFGYKQAQKAISLQKNIRLND